MNQGGKPWAIVLSGGNGERMRHLTKEWLGEHRPKQYCTFVGTRSMLEHTLDRTKQVVRQERILTVVGCGHRRFLDRSRLAGRVIEQPRNLDIAAGIFLPATYIMASDPAATILIFPADHFVFPEDRFLVQVVRAGLLAQSHQNSLILLGAEADQPEPEYGWIQAGGSRQTWVAGQVKDIISFKEKPSPEEAETFFNRGYFWNTLIMAVKVKTLWRLGHEFLPEMMSEFEMLYRVLQAVQAGRAQSWDASAALSHIYQKMEPSNFSRDLLQRAVKHTLVLPMSGLIWSDWGRDERIAESLAQIGKAPLFSGALQATHAGEPYQV